MEIIAPDDEEQIRIKGKLREYLKANGYKFENEDYDNGTDTLNMVKKGVCAVHIEVIPWDTWTEE